MRRAVLVTLGLWVTACGRTAIDECAPCDQQPGTVCYRVLRLGGPDPVPPVVLPIHCAPMPVGCDPSDPCKCLVPVPGAWCRRDSDEPRLCLCDNNAL